MPQNESGWTGPILGACLGGPGDAGGAGAGGDRSLSVGGLPGFPRVAGSPGPLTGFPPNLAPAASRGCPEAK